MGELKSAREIALEKAKKLGDLSPEERRRQKEKEHLQIARTLADKYFAHPDAKLLTGELAKHDGQERDSITRLLIRQLVDAIDISGTRAQQAMDGILSLGQNSAIKDTVARIKDVLQEYQLAQAREREDVEKAGREILHQMRIAGSAISRINIRAKQEWQKRLEKIATPYKETLKSLKKLLTEVTLSNTRSP